SKDEDDKYLARFAAGIAATSLKNIDKALEQYQKALELKPDSEEVKKNIELLWQGGGDGEGESDQQQKGDQKGEGESDPKEDQDGEGDNDEKKPPQQQKPQPQNFQSKDLTPDQVRKIL